MIRISLYVALGFIGWLLSPMFLGMTMRSDPDSDLKQLTKNDIDIIANKYSVSAVYVINNIRKYIPKK